MTGLHRLQDEDPALRQAFRADPQVGPERCEEPPLRRERHAAHHVPERRAVEDDEEQAREREDDVPDGCPREAVDVAAELDRDAPQHEEPEDDHERQVKAAEARRVERREGEVERAPGGDQPDLVPVPHGSDRAQHEAPLGVRPSDDEMDRACTEIEAVENHVHDPHEGEQAEPEVAHARLSRSPPRARGRARSPDKRGRERGQ